MFVPLSGHVEHIIKAAFIEFSESRVPSKVFLNSKELSPRKKVVNLLVEVPELEDDSGPVIKIVPIEQQPTTQSGTYGTYNLCCMDCYNAYSHSIHCMCMCIQVCLVNHLKYPTRIPYFWFMLFFIFFIYNGS